jgi:hypothetical protein
MCSIDTTSLSARPYDAEDVTAAAAAGGMVASWSKRVFNASIVSCNN